MSLRTKITIFNAALLRCGQETTSSGSGSAFWRAMDANYDDIVRARFEEGDGNFPFGRARKEMTSRQDGTFGFDDAYKLPSEALHIYDVYIDGYSCADLQAPWEIDAENSLVLVNAGTRKVEVEYVRTGQEHTWSASFSQAIQRDLEAVIKEVQEETGEAERKTSFADQQMLKAGVNASKQRGPKPVFRPKGGRLHRARRGEYS